MKTPTRRIDDMKDFMDVLKAAIGVLTVVVGGLFAIVEYREKQAADRIKETLGMVERFHKDPVSSAYNRMSRVWLENESNVIDALTSAEDSENKWKKVTLQVIEENHLEPEIFTTIDFFRELKTCIDNKICNAGVAKAFFFVEAKSFYNAHYPYISEKRVTRKDVHFAEDLKDFVGARE